MDEEIVELVTSIKAKRKKLGLSVKDIAMWEGIKPRTAYYWLRGEHLSDHLLHQKGRKALRRILHWLIRLETGKEPMPEKCKLGY